MSSSTPLLSNMERIALFTRLIDAFPKGHPLKRYRGDVYFEISNFYFLFGTMEREGWTSGVINQQIDVYLARLEPTQAAIEEAWTDKLRAAVHEFDNYQLLLAQLNWENRDGILDNMGQAIPDDPLVEQLSLLFHYLAAEQDILYSGDAMLFELLHAPWFNIPPIEIARLTLALSDRQRDETSLRQLLQEKVNTPPRDLFTPPVHEGLQKASEAIENLTGMVPPSPLSSLVDLILRETGMGDFINNNPAQAIAVTNFIDYIAAEARLNPSMDLQLLVKLLMLLQHTAPTILPEPVNGQEGIIAVLAPLYQPGSKTSTIYTGSAWAQPGRPEIGKLEEMIEGKLLQRFMLHVTALNSYLRCPLEFYFHSMLRVPSPRNEATEFGSAVHYALELLFRKMQTDNDAFPSKAIFISDFEEYMYQHRKSFTPEQFNRRLQYGHEVLNNYYDEYAHTWNTIVAVERNIRNVIVAGVPIKGKIDKLEFDGKSVNVVDYKTGDPDKSKARLERPGEKLPNGGDYWRQAVFYKILVDNYQQKEWKVSSTEFDFIEPDKSGLYHKERFFITPAEVAVVTQQIVATWQRIQQRDFYTGCGKPGCHWCHFVKTYGLAVALHE
jgi:hypothetical protein